VDSICGNYWCRKPRELSKLKIFIHWTET